MGLVQSLVCSQNQCYKSFFPSSPMLLKEALVLAPIGLYKLSNYKTFLHFVFTQVSKICDFCSRILNVPNEKNCCNNLSNRNVHLFDTIHPNYHIAFPLVVCENVMIFVPTLSLFLASSLSHFLFLCVSAWQLSPPPYPSHIKAHNIWSWIIIDFNKVI